MSAHFDYDKTLAAERAINETYLRQLREGWGKAAAGVGAVGIAANVIWGGAAPKVAARRSGALTGRVALDCEDPDLRDFYVGPAHAENDDEVLVVSWAAPLAGLFFDGRDWDPRRVPDPRAAPNPATLLGRRTFSARGDNVVRFVDDLESGADRHSVFRRAAEAPTIPAPPSMPSPPRTPALASDAPPMEPPPPAAVATPPADDRDPQGDSPVGADQVGEHVGPPADDRDPRVDSGAARIEEVSSSLGEERQTPQPSTELRRAGPLVLEALGRPRDSRLHSVLRTLQPDQYRYVTWSAREHLAVRGHPGTGKTILATHRAAFLTHIDDSGHLRRVALVGPTDEWTTHVYGVLDETGAQGVEVISIETLIRGLAEGKLARESPTGGSAQPLHRANERPFQTGWTLGRVAGRAAVELADQLSRSSNATKKMRLVAERIIEASALGGDLVNDLSAECRDWLSSVKSYENARQDSSCLLFLASVGMAILPPSSRALYEHLIVDEVQDLRPAEWRILDTLLRPEGRWSLFGDMNQRRADVTWDSWGELMSKLELGPEDGSTPEPEVLHTGYRSNDAILRFAGWLLPRSGRNQRSLRGGGDDSIHVRRVRPADLPATVENEARTLAEEFSDGIVAVIVWSQDRLDQVRANALEWGWRRVPGPANRTTFTLLESLASGAEPVRRATLRILRAVQARGLEFDGVVVVEPADFQKNLGRHGSLYTSLTRANKKLVVVHSKPLPQALKGRVRSDPARR